MRRSLSLVLLMAFLLAAACVEEYNPAADTPAHPPAPVTTPSANPPAPAPTPLPQPVAFIAGIQCAVGDRSVDAYHCNGDVRIPGGEYDTVQIIAVYADNNTFRSNTVSLGGNDAVAKPFVFFPDIKYQGMNPAYFVRLDDRVYPVAWNGGAGTAMSNTPGAEGIGIE